MEHIKMELAEKIVNFYENYDFYDFMDKCDDKYEAVKTVDEDLKNPRYRHSLFIALQAIADDDIERKNQIEDICKELTSYNTSRKYVIPPLRVATGEGEVSLDVSYMAEIKDYYEKQCLLQYMIDNYNLLELDVIRDVVCKAKSLMDRYGFSDVKAIEETFKNINDIKLMRNYVYGYEFASDYGENLSGRDCELYQLFLRRLNELNASYEQDELEI